MNNSLIYSGPGKLFSGSSSIFANGEQGEVKMAVEQETDPVASALVGRIDETVGNNLIKITTDPFDNWGALALLYPSTIKTPSIGTRFASANTAWKIWTADGRLFTIPNAFVSKHPEIHLGVGTPLFRGLEVTGVVKNATEMGDTGSFYVLASAQADPGGAFTLSDFIRGPWTGAWGTVAGFGGDAGAALQAEDEWVISFDVKYKPLAVQKLVRSFELSSVAVMVKLRPVGPTQQNIDDALGIQNSGRLLGSRVGASGSTLILTGPGSKTITIYNANLVRSGYDFGGAKLGNGEIAFVTGSTFSAGAYQPLIAFSA